MGLRTGKVTVYPIIKSIVSPKVGASAGENVSVRPLSIGEYCWPKSPTSCANGDTCTDPSGKRKLGLIENSKLLITPPFPARHPTEPSAMRSEEHTSELQSLRHLV